jgi:hypothetical protein
MLVSRNISFQEARHSDLWLKYKFICSCNRCIATPEPYVDLILNVRMQSGIKYYPNLFAIFHLLSLVLALCSQAIKTLHFHIFMDYYGNC